jgi:small subunit ribosomal protein S7
MRRTKPEQREIEGDVRYDSETVAKFINRLMKDGKKSVARRVLYQAFEIIEERSGQNALEVFEEAVKNASPVLEVRPRRVGGATYQVPVEVTSDRRQALSMRWLLGAARARPGKAMADKLANELMDASNHQGLAVRRREEVHRMAEANRAFAHYRW